MGRLSKRNIQILVGAWIGTMLLVGACVFLGVFFALNRTATTANDPVDAPPTAQADAADGPTATPLATSAPSEGAPVDGLTPTVPPIQDDSFGYGIQARLEFVTEDTLNLVDELGLNWVKQQLRWNDLEPAPGEANWQIIEDIFQPAADRDIKVMVSVLGAPAWAADTGANPERGLSPPADPQVYADYLSELITRNRGRIHAVEVWNEQNLRREWVTDRPLSAEEYMELLIPASQAIREADPNVIIISGALTPTGQNDGNEAIADFQYLQQMIDAGMLDYVDCVGIHPSGYNLPPDEPYDDFTEDPNWVFKGPVGSPHPSWSFYSTMTGYRDIIVAAGYDTPLCVTEFGWASVEGMDGEPRQNYEFAYDNSLQEQADYIVQSFEMMHDWDWVWLAFLFNLDYSPKIGGDPQDDSALFSILGGDGTPRPAFEALRDMPKPP